MTKVSELSLFEPSERDEQVAFVQWLDISGYKFTAIPNGGHRHIGQAVKLKEEGVRPGLPDILVIVKNRLVWVEMKRPDLKPKRDGKGGISDEQYRWHDALNACDNCQVFVCYSADEARAVIERIART